MRKILKLFAPILVIGAAIGGYVLLQVTKPEPEQKDDGPRPVSLFVETAKSEDLRLTVSTQGEVRPRTEIDLISQVSGRVVSVADEFTAGGKVANGVALIKIEDTEYRLLVTGAEARVASAVTQLELAEAAAAIARRNWDDTIVGKPTPLAMKEPQRAEAKANLRAAEADLSVARLNLARTSISVPFDGRVRSKNADIGQYVTPGTKLGRVYSTAVAEIRLALSDSQLATVGLPIGYSESDGDGPRVMFDAIIAGVSHSWQGRIVRTDAALDASTRVLYAIAEVEAPYNAGADNGVPLAMGLYVNATIDGVAMRNAITVPRAALRSGDKVYVIAKDGTLDIRTVTISYSDAEKIVLSGGIEAGEQVVVSPVRSPRDGMEVVALERQSLRQATAAHQLLEGK